MKISTRKGIKILLASLLTLLTLASCAAEEQNTGDPTGSSSSIGGESVEQQTETSAVFGKVDPDADAVEGIAIRSAEDLQKIGTSADYPLDGDYTLVADLNLSQIENFTPIGGSVSECGIVKGDNVFSGTFDGRGHTIVGLSIDISSGERVHVGMFGSVGSDDKTNPAIIKNLIFREVNVTGSMKDTATYGGLAGQVNGYATIDNIALLSGKVSVKNDGGNLLGVGALIGQCRTQQSTGCSNAGINITNIFTNVEVSARGFGGPTYISGVIGRIRGSELGSLSNVIHIGTATHEGDMAFAIADGDAGAKISKNVHYLEEAGYGYFLGQSHSYSEMTQGELKLNGQYWHKEVGSFPLLNIVHDSPLFSALDFLSLALENNESPDSVKSSFNLPDSVMEQPVTWTSSDEKVLTINENRATVIRPKLGYTNVVLTAHSNGASKDFSLRIFSGVNGEIVRDLENNTLIAKNYPKGVTYKWVARNVTTDQVIKNVTTEEGVLPLSDNMKNCLVTLKVEGFEDAAFYYSNLPTISISSDASYYEVAKGVYSEATLSVTNVPGYKNTKYSGGTQIKLRGNSTAYQPKRPFRLKLDKKVDMFGMGESKHWVLLANYYDRTNLRNKLSYDLGGALGLAQCESILVNLIYNGEYVGLYQLSENIRIDEGRVDIFDWEEAAEDVAKAIANKEGLTMEQREALENGLYKNLSWVTTGVHGTYDIADYYDMSTLDITGGYLIENDYYYDEITKFTTDNEMKMMVQSPKYLSSNPEMMNTLVNYIQEMEDCLYSPTKRNEVGKHYSDYMDVESFLDFFVVNQLFKNVELFYKSCYMYKDVGGLLTFGPIWDMDWATGNHMNLGDGIAAHPDSWKQEHSQDREYWYKAMYNDPYFMIMLCEHWATVQDEIDAMMEQLNTLSAEIEEAATADNKLWYYDWSVKKEVSDLKFWLIDRREWLNQQMADPETLLRSFDYYIDSKKIGITGFYEGDDYINLTITVLDEETFKSCDLMINGQLVRNVEIKNGSKIRIEKSELREKGKYNSIEILGKRADGSYNTVQKRRGQRGSTMYDADFVYYVTN